MSEQTTAPTERDELALELFIGDNHKQPRETSIQDWKWLNDTSHARGSVEHYKTMAQHAVTMGYRKPRTVTTVEELAGLDGGTIIRAVKSEHNPHGLCFEKYGKEWLALDPADREDGEVTIPHTAVLRFYGAHSITVLFTPESAS